MSRGPAAVENQAPGTLVSPAVTWWPPKRRLAAVGIAQLPQGPECQRLCQPQRFLFFVTNFFGWIRMISQTEQMASTRKFGEVKYQFSAGNCSINITFVAFNLLHEDYLQELSNI